jgi:protein SOK2
MKSLDSATGEDIQDANVNNNNGSSASNNKNNNTIKGDDVSPGVNNTGVSGHPSNQSVQDLAQKNPAQGTQINGTQGQNDDPYRYSQQQQVPGQPQYPYYAYQPMYSQQQQQQQFQGQYPAYYQSSMSSATGSTAQPSAQQLGSTGYPDYSNYSRMNYVQNFTPVYGQTGMMNMPASSVSSGSGVSGVATSQQNPTQITTVTASGIGQVQPVGSRPRVTTTMWEDEKTLCYQVDANNVSVVRRADNNMINGTKLLNVAHMTRGRRDGILKSEKVRDVVKIGSMHLKGVWIPFERALAMAQREGIVDLLYPLFVRDIKQVIQQGSTTQPQANPQQWGYQQSSAAVPGSVPAPSAAISQSGSTLTQAPNTAASAQQQTQMKQSNSPYMTPSSLGSTNIDSKATVQGAAQQPQSSQPIQQQGIPQPLSQQTSYYGYPYYPQYQYGYGYGASSAASGTGGATVSGLPQSNSASLSGASNGGVTGAVGAGSAAASQYQYPQYGYGYMPQYQAPQFDDQKDK